jgi:hypothetical protein
MTLFFPVTFFSMLSLLIFYFHNFGEFPDSKGVQGLTEQSTRD